jgi:hypothetical protein
VNNESLSLKTTGFSTDLQYFAFPLLIASIMKPHILLVCLLAMASLLPAQDLEVGGHVGASNIEAQSPGSTAGLFAALRGNDWRLGLRVELNYENHAESPSLTQVPVLATLPLDRQRMVELHAGPYLSRQSAVDQRPLFKFGFSTGLQVNLPLSSRLVLTTKGQADQALRTHEPSEEAQLAPARNLSFRISFGLAYRLLHRK